MQQKNQTIDALIRSTQIVGKPVKLTGIKSPNGDDVPVPDPKCPTFP